MAWRRVSSFVGGAVGSWLYSVRRRRSPTRLQTSNLRAGPALRGQFNRTFVVRTLRWSRSTYRRSSSAIVSDRETGSERKNQNGNDLAAKSAFPAWTRGGVRLHAIVGAGAVGGRSTGGHHAAAAPAEATGTHGMQRRQGRRTDRHERRHHTRRTGKPAPAAAATPAAIAGPSALKRLIARFDKLGIAYAFGGPRNERDRRRKEKEEDESITFPQNSRESIL